MQQDHKLTVVPQMDPYTKERISRVITAMEAAGYNPLHQLYGYVTTGNIAYITRRDDARTIVQTIDRRQLQSYVRYLASA